MIKPRKKPRWKKQYASKTVRRDKFTYRGVLVNGPDGLGTKLEFLVDGKPLFKVGLIAVDRTRAKAFVDKMNGLTTLELKEFGQHEAAKFLKEVEEGSNEKIKRSDSGDRSYAEI